MSVVPEDTPASPPEFAFELLARTLVELIDQRRSTAFVVGLHGPWGSGKTTLLNTIRDDLQKTPGSVVIEFNAWKYQGREALWRALILRVLNGLREAGADEHEIANLERSLYESFTEKEYGRLRVNWTSVVTEAVMLILSLSGFGVGGGLVRGAAKSLRRVFGIDAADKEGRSEVSQRVERVAGILKREVIERSVQQVVSIEQFLKMFQKAAGRLGESGRIYVLIDDLDRCLPDSALEVFEAVKLFLDAPECVYVIAVDRAVIRRGLELRYPARSESIEPPVVDPDEYIEKTISLSFDLPLLGASDASQLLSRISLPVALTRTQCDTLIRVLGTNPRRLKRFGGSLAVWLGIAWQLRRDGVRLAFDPLETGNIELFLKLAVIGYLNGGIIDQMIRDPELGKRLQQVSNAAATEASPQESQFRISEMLKNELPVVRAASVEPALWRAFALMQPNFAQEGRVSCALRWFRS